MSLNMNKILVIGDSCFDEFVYCNAERLAPDLPIPILNVVETKSNPGMALNVLRNIKNYIPETDIVTNKNWERNKKTRYIDLNTNHAFIRIDTHEKIQPYQYQGFDEDFETIVISDYNKGFLNEDTIAQILSEHKNTFLDTKKVLGNWARDAKYIKINDYEFQRSLPNIDSEIASKIIHTRGKHGCDFQGQNYPVTPVEVKDASGAGDSFLAALVVSFQNTRDIYKSIEFANTKATKVVTQKGVTLIE
jgi:bifunctional ADP-heptose synthase (sugar kinase/adenylyltransferase)